MTRSNRRAARIATTSADEVFRCGAVVEGGWGERLGASLLAEAVILVLAHECVEEVNARGKTYLMSRRGEMTCRPPWGGQLGWPRFW